MVIASIITLATPWVFARIAEVASDGSLVRVDNGPLIPLITLLILFSVIGGITLLIRKTIRSSSEQRRQFVFVLLGMSLTFLLLMAFNFILPAFLNITSFIIFGAIFLLPFITLTFYSISRYHLLNVKVISTEIVAFILSVATLLEVVVSSSVLETVLRTGIFILVLIFSIFLIRSVRKEVEQRQQLQILDEKLEAANTQLEDLSRFKSQLLSLASHQMKSPLAAIKGFGSLITDGLYGAVPDKVKETVEKMKRSADDLIDLINTLLDMRKVEEGKMDYQFARVDLNKMVGEMVDLLKPLAGEKKLEFTFVSPGKEVPVNADAQKLKQVIQNLTDNAIKYTPSGFVHVTLTIDPSMVLTVPSVASRAGDLPPAVSPQGIPMPPGAGYTGAAIVSVSDSGYGVPATLLPYLFEEFVRDERVKKQVRGTGLGLYIARKIAEAHGGTIKAASDGEGKGSTFSVIVPMMR